MTTPAKARQTGPNHEPWCACTERICFGALDYGDELRHKCHPWEHTEFYVGGQSRIDSDVMHDLAGRLPLSAASRKVIDEYEAEITYQTSNEEATE